MKSEVSPGVSLTQNGTVTDYFLHLEGPAELQWVVTVRLGALQCKADLQQYSDHSSSGEIDSVV